MSDAKLAHFNYGQFGGFDPNILNTHVSSKIENIKSLSQNKAIQKLKYGESYVNMASTIKPLTILIGLNEKLFNLKILI